MTFWSVSTFASRFALTSRGENTPAGGTGVRPWIAEARQKEVQ